MEIDALRRATLSTPVNFEPVFRNEEERQIVTAVRALNKMEFLGSDRELMFARDTVTQRPVIRILDRQTGERLEQIPSEQLLHIMDSLDIKSKGEENS